MQNLLHLSLGLGRDDARAARVVTELGSVRHAVTHVVQTTLIEEIDDQLQLVHTLEVRHLGLIARFGESLESGLDEGADATAQHDLFAEQVGFSLFSDGRFDDAAACPADPLSIGQRQLAAHVRGTGRQRDQTRHAAPFFVLTANQMARPLGGDQSTVGSHGRNHLTEVQVETVRTHQQRARLEVRPDVALIGVALNFVGEQDVDQITDLGRFSQRDGCEAVADGQIVVLAAGALPDDDVAAAVAQVLSLSVTLAAVAEDGNGLALQQGQVGIVVVVNLRGHRGSRLD